MTCALRQTSRFKTSFLFDLEGATVICVLVTFQINYVSWCRNQQTFVLASRRISVLARCLQLPEADWLTSILGKFSGCHEGLLVPTSYLVCVPSTAGRATSTTWLSLAGGSANRLLNLDYSQAILAFQSAPKLVSGTNPTCWLLPLKPYTTVEGKK